MIRTAANHTHGFTLIELILVIVIASILAVTAGPAIFTSSGTDEYLFQSRLVSVMRMQQQRAMQDTSQCYGVRIENNRFGAVNDCTAAAIPNPLPNEGSGISAAAATAAAVTISSSGAAVPYTVGFNGLGCPVSAPLTCNDSVDHEITITNSASIKVCVSSQGYINVGACE